MFNNNNQTSGFCDYAQSTFRSGPIEANPNVIRTHGFLGKDCQISIQRDDNFSQQNIFYDKYIEAVKPHSIAGERICIDEKLSSPYFMLFQEIDLKSNEPITDESIIKLCSKIVAKTTNFFPDLKFAEQSKDTSSFDEWLIPKNRKKLFDLHRNFNSNTGEWHGCGTGRHRLRAMVSLPSPPGKDHVQLGTIPKVEDGKTFYKAGAHINYIGRLHVKTEQARMIAEYVRSKLEAEEPRNPNKGENPMSSVIDGGPYNNEVQGGVRMLYAVKYKKCKCKTPDYNCRKCSPNDRVYKPFIILDCDGKEDKNISWIIEPIESHIEKYLQYNLLDYDEQLEKCAASIIKAENGDASVRRVREICNVKLRTISSDLRSNYSKYGNAQGWEKSNLASKDDEEFLASLPKNNQALDVYKNLYVRKLLQQDSLRRVAYVHLSEVDPAILSIKAACIRTCTKELRHEVFKPPADCRLDIRKFTKAVSKKNKKFQYMSSKRMPQGEVVHKGNCKVGQYLDPSCRVANDICDAIRNLPDGQWDDISLYRILRKHKHQYIVELQGGGQYCLKKGDNHSNSAIYFLLKPGGIHQKCRCQKPDYGCNGKWESPAFPLFDELRELLFFDMINEDINFLQNRRFGESAYQARSETPKEKPAPSKDQTPPKPQSNPGPNTGTNSSPKTPNKDSSKSKPDNGPEKPSSQENRNTSSDKQNTSNGQNQDNTGSSEYTKQHSSQEGAGESASADPPKKTKLDDMPTPCFVPSDDPNAKTHMSTFQNQCFTAYDKAWFKLSVEKYPEETREFLEKQSGKKTNSWKSSEKRPFDESFQNKDSRPTGNRSKGPDGKRQKTNSGRKFYTDENGVQQEITVNEKNQGSSKNTTAVLNDGIVWGTTIF